MKKMVPLKNTLILKASHPADVRYAGALLKAGQVVAIPTETVYGLGGLGLHAQSVASIYEAKNRPQHNPLILHVANLEMALSLWNLDGEDGARVRTCIETLAQLFWPGPLTLVAPKAAHVPGSVSAGLNSLAVRMPAHPVTRQLIEWVGEPLAAPSANVANRPSPTRAGHVMRSLSGRIAAVLDAGPCEAGIESTVVDVRSDPIKILRAGTISGAVLCDKLAISDISTANLGSPSHAPAVPTSPGQLSRHYAPSNTRLHLLGHESLQEAWQSGMPVLIRAATQARLSHELGDRPLNSLTFTMPDSPEAYGRALYGAFYNIEAQDLEEVGMEDLVPTSPMSPWWAIQDRLLRASYQGPK